jgi:hypothetical protein
MAVDQTGVVTGGLTGAVVTGGLGGFDALGGSPGFTSAYLWWFGGIAAPFRVDAPAIHGAPRDAGLVGADVDASLSGRAVQ